MSWQQIQLEVLWKYPVSKEPKSTIILNLVIGDLMQKDTPGKQRIINAIEKSFHCLGE